MRKFGFLAKCFHQCLAALMFLPILLQTPQAFAQEQAESQDPAAKPIPVQEVTLEPQGQFARAVRKGVSVNKAPRSLFLIKRKIDESEFGEPTIYPFERHQRVISYDQRMEDPLSNQR